MGIWIACVHVLRHKTCHTRDITYVWGVAFEYVKKWGVTDTHFVRGREREREKAKKRKTFRILKGEMK